MVNQTKKIKNIIKSVYPSTPILMLNLICIPTNQNPVNSLTFTGGVMLRCPKQTPQEGDVLITPSQMPKSCMRSL